VKLLLDTHIWLWSLIEPNRLARRVRAALRSHDNELWLSPISVWEALILIEKGRVAVDVSAEFWIEEARRIAPMVEATLTSEVAILSRLVTLPHQDPADRFLLASAKIYGLTLVTGDRRLLLTKDVPVMSNR